VIGTILHTGLAHGVADAEAVAAESVRLVPAHDHNALGTFGGIIARRTPVVVVREQSSGTLAFAALNEGRGKALRYGSYDGDTLARLSWMETELAQMLGQAIRLAGAIDLFEIMSQALHMGDIFKATARTMRDRSSAVVKSPRQWGSEHSRWRQRPFSRAT